MAIGRPRTDQASQTEAAVNAKRRGRRIIGAV